MFGKRHLLTVNALILAGFSIHLLIVPRHAEAQTETVLYNFCSQQNCADGTQPYASLIRDKEGNLYGTALFGGAYHWGTVFMVSPTGTETVLYSFCSQANCADGSEPNSGLIADEKGNLYGVTADGGSSNLGTVYKLSPAKAGAWTETVLYSFAGGSGDGLSPGGNLIRDESGNFYGATPSGGAFDEGTVFKLTPTGSESIFHSFGSHYGDGAVPSGGLIIDKEGNLYGTTGQGGAHGQGTAFKISSTGVETVLYSFCSQSNCTDGASPSAGLLMGGNGDLYGTTFYGGGSDTCGDGGCGTVFRITAKGEERMLFAFTFSDGDNPAAALITYKGDLYGNTINGGLHGYGTVFKVNLAGEQTVLYSFCSEQNCTDGGSPQGALIVDASGNLYGTTPSGGLYSNGTVYKVTP
jgi:uncharacterized repeat protein (TIGR03803 family)